MDISKYTLRDMNDPLANPKYQLGWYKSIEEVQPEILWQMLSMSEYKDAESQKIIKKEINKRRVNI